MVLALEHRDGSGPFVLTRSPLPARTPNDDSGKSKLYVKPLDVECVLRVYLHYTVLNNCNVFLNSYRFITDQATEPFAFRVEQLLFRRLEVYVAYNAFTAWVGGQDSQKPILGPSAHPHLHVVDGPSNLQLDSKLESPWQDRAFAESWQPVRGKPRVQCGSDVVLAGHSFGGATMVRFVCNQCND